MSAEPTFDEFATELAAADLRSKAANADATQARAEKSGYAVNAIIAAYKESLSDETIRDTLLAKGVLKGTVSKIITITAAIRAGDITTADLKSLNGAYTTVKAVHASKAAIAASKPAKGTVAFADPIPVPTSPISTPDDAIKLLIDTVKSVTDADERFKLAGEFISKITRQLGEASKKKDDDDED